MIGKLGSTALEGIQRSSQGLVQNASEIARATTPADQTKVTEALVGLKQHEQGLKANMKTFETADKLIGSLLDVRA